MHIHPYTFIGVKWYQQPTCHLPTTNLPPACRKACSSDSETFSLFRYTFSRFCVCGGGGLAGPQGERQGERISLRGVLHAVFECVSRQHHTLKHSQTRTRAHTHSHTHTNTHTVTLTHSHIHIHIHIRMHMHMHMHIHTLFHTHTHTHTQYMHFHAY